MRLIHTPARLALALALVLAPGCSDSEYTNASCYFVFDTSIHNTSIIKNALDPNIKGIFVRVSTGVKGDVRYVRAELGTGQTEETRITTAEETRVTYQLGRYNEAGLIIGYPTFGDRLYAYDALCPNCFKNSLYRILSFSNNGAWAYCGTCKRDYDLNNGGVVAQGDHGDKLERYANVTYTGTRLFVAN